MPVISWLERLSRGLMLLQGQPWLHTEFLSIMGYTVRLGFKNKPNNSKQHTLARCSGVYL